MNAEKRVESPIPLLPLSSPDAETENLIKKKDEEVRRAGGEGKTQALQMLKNAAPPGPYVTEMLMGNNVVT